MDYDVNDIIITNTNKKKDKYTAKYAKIHQSYCATEQKTKPGI